MNGQELVEDPQIRKVLKRKVDNDPGLPGVVGAIRTKGRPIRIAAAGVRKAGEDIPMTGSDVIHLGSCTKAITATLVGRLVDRGMLRWDERLRDRLPKLAKQIHSDYGQVTLQQLLQHRSGMPANATNWWLQQGDSIQEKRFQIAVDSLAGPPEHPEEQFLYSNLGYMVAGMFIEAATKTSWEKALRSELFQPLGLRSAGFGPPGTRGQIDQPWGHVSLGPRLLPMQRDNAPALGPAGTVHMSVSDWARVAMLHVDGKHAGETCLGGDTLTQLHQPGAGQEYAMGWKVLQRPWGQGQVLTHSGSNTMWFCTIWLAPNTNTAYLVATNVAGEDIPQKVDDLIGQLIRIDRS